MNRVKRFNKIFPRVLLLWHLFFAWVAYDYVNHRGGDAVGYWLVGKKYAHFSWGDFAYPGPDFIKFITYPLAKILHLPAWVGFGLFSLWSFIGLFLLWKMLLRLSGGKTLPLLFPALLLMLPNLHYWTSMLGKEALLFTPTVIILYRFYRKKYFSIWLLLSFLLIGWVRPHFAFVILIAYLIALFFKGGLKRKSNVWLGTTSAVFIAGLYFFLMKITWVKSNLLREILERYKLHPEVLKSSSSYVPLEDYPYPYKVFTFFFRPLPGEGGGTYWKVLEAQNLLFLIVMLATAYILIRNFKKINWSAPALFCVLLLFFYVTMYVYAYSNFGLIVRTKVLIMPVIVAGAGAVWGLKKR